MRPIPTAPEISTKLWLLTWTVTAEPNYWCQQQIDSASKQFGGQTAAQRHLGRYHSTEHCLQTLLALLSTMDSQSVLVPKTAFASGKADEPSNMILRLHVSVYRRENLTNGDTFQWSPDESDCC
jgi:hypothetical protein